MGKTFKQTQEAELVSWFSAEDKEIRERIRYPLLRKQMGLEHLDTSQMEVWDIGCGPYGGVSSIINCKKIVRVDPLMEEYKKNVPLEGAWIGDKAEDLDERLSSADLIIITNALDHFEDPQHFLRDLCRFGKPGVFFAHVHAINNAYSHPHEAHAQNVYPQMFQEYLQHDFETAWYDDTITYGWRHQKAFSGLYRKCSGYAL